MEISDDGRKYHEKELIETTVFYISASISLLSDGFESVHGCTAVLRLRRLSLRKCKRLFESCLVIVWAIDVDDVIFEGCKWPVEEHKRIG